MEMPVNAGRKFGRIMGHHYESLAGIGTVSVNDGADSPAIGVVQAMHRLVKQKQWRILYEGSGYQAHALFSTGQRKEIPLCKRCYAEAFHPFQTFHPPAFIRSAAESDGVEEAACNDVQCRNVPVIGTVHLRGDVADIPFYVPDAFPGSAPAPEKLYITGITLRVVGADEAQQRAFAGAVVSGQSPVLPLPYLPVQIAQDCPVPISYRYSFQAQDRCPFPCRSVCGIIGRLRGFAGSRRCAAG